MACSVRVWPRAAVPTCNFTESPSLLAQTGTDHIAFKTGNRSFGELPIAMKLPARRIIDDIGLPLLCIKYALGQIDGPKGQRHCHFIRTREQHTRLNFRIRYRK